MSIVVDIEQTLGVHCDVNNYPTQSTPYRNGALIRFHLCYIVKFIIQIAFPLICISQYVDFFEACERFQRRFSQANDEPRSSFIENARESAMSIYDIYLREGSSHYLSRLSRITREEIADRIKHNDCMSISDAFSLIYSLSLLSVFVAFPNSASNSNLTSLYFLPPSYGCLIYLDICISLMTVSKQLFSTAKEEVVLILCQGPFPRFLSGFCASLAQDMLLNDSKVQTIKV